MGPALEGSGSAAEELLLRPFLRTVTDDLAFNLYVLDFAIRDARYSGTTDATLQKYFRADCSAPDAPDTIEFTKDIANNYGLTGKLADTVAIRAHAGTQYLQYVWGTLQMLEDIELLQDQIDPSRQHPIDPFVLFACGLNTPKRTAEYVADLRACVVR